MMRKVFLSLAILLVSTYAFTQDYSFRLQKSGKGKQAIFFIPGFACSGDVWKETVAVLEKDYTCYVLTMAGFSGVPSERDPSFEHWKNQISAFITHEKIEKPIVVGHSMGGGLALAIAADYPNLLQKIVVVDALPCLMALTNPQFKTIPDYDCSGMIRQITAMEEGAFAQMQKISVAGLTLDTTKFDTIVNWSLASDRYTFAKMYCDFSNTDLRERIKNITIPSLILLEAHFKNIATAIENQYRTLPTAKLEYATKGLHFLMFDDKEWFIHQVSKFIKE